MRNQLNEIYFGKTKDIVNGLRSSASLSEGKQREVMMSDLAEALKHRQPPPANNQTPPPPVNQLAAPLLLLALLSIDELFDIISLKRCVCMHVAVCFSADNDRSITMILYDFSVRPVTMATALRFLLGCLCAVCDCTFLIIECQQTKVFILSTH